MVLLDAQNSVSLHVDVPDSLGHRRTGRRCNGIRLNVVLRSLDSEGASESDESGLRSTILNTISEFRQSTAEETKRMRTFAWPKLPSNGKRSVSIDGIKHKGLHIPT